MVGPPAGLLTSSVPSTACTRSISPLKPLEADPISAGCAKGCGYNGVFSEYGSTTPFQGTAVEDHITYDQNNHFSQNTYIGPWSFMVHEQGTIVSWAQWQGGPYNEDSGSTLSS